MVCPYSLTVPGGVQVQVLALARMLRSEGIDARVLGPCDGPPPDAAVTPLGNSAPLKANGSMAAIAPDIPATLRTIRALRDGAFDVVHLHEPFVPGPTLTTLIACDRPMIGTFHRSGQSAWYRMLRPFARWTVDNLAVRVAVSEEAAATAERTLGGDYKVLWNGLDVGAYRKAEPWPGGERTVFFVGRHEPRKGLAVLLDAMADVAPGTRLWIAGEGPQDSSLRSKVRGNANIEWLGTISEAEKLRRLKGAAVVCAPSTHGESFGVVLLEAISAGTPVVATDLPGYRNVVRPGVEGLLVPPGDPAALAGALNRSLAGGPEIDAMVEAGWSRAEHFGLDRLARRYVELYERMLGPSAPA
jgi:phosphatidyl-myo-inositol alpha-mannosyltransferase